VHLAGEETAADIARHLLPPPKLTAPPTSAEAWRERRAAVERHNLRAEQQVRRAIDALQKADLVEAGGRVRLAEWFERSMARFGLAGAVERAHPAWPSNLPDLAGYRAMVAEMATGGPRSVRALLGANPCGARKRVYRDLAFEWHVLVVPSQRVPTPAGVALVERARGAA
jgi:hypothetical protein